MSDRASIQAAARLDVESCVNEITEDFRDMDFTVAREDVAKMISILDVLDDKDRYRWVESADSVPDGLEALPHIVYCSLSRETGSEPVKHYKPVAKSATGQGG